MEIGTGDILGFIKMFKENLHKLHCFCFVFAQSFKLDMDPDPHLEKLMDPDPEKNKCGSTALGLTKKKCTCSVLGSSVWMRCCCNRLLESKNF